MGQQNELQIGVAGQEVILNCKGIRRDAAVTWNYYKVVIRQFRSEHLRGKGSSSSSLLPTTWLRNLFPPNQAYIFKRQSFHDRSV